MNSHDEGYDKKLLLVSAALNIFLIGIFLGSASYYSLWDEIKPSSNTETGINHDPLMNLSEDRRQFIKTGMDAIQKEIIDTRAETAKLKKESLALLTTEPFKEKTYIDFNKRMYERAVQLKLHTTQTIADLAAKANAVERKIIMEELSQITPASMQPQEPKRACHPNQQAPSQHP